MFWELKSIDLLRDYRKSLALNSKRSKWFLGKIRNIDFFRKITSDRRWKSDIKNSDLGLDFINKLRPVSYLRKNDETKKIEYGFIAQELEETLNKIGISSAGILTKDSQGMYGVRYNDFIAPMVKAIQEQQTQIEELKALVKQLLAKK